MTISERYRVASMHKKKKNNRLFHIIILFFLMVPFTFARYTDTSDFELKAEVADWSISINGEAITQNTTTLANKIDLKYSGKESGNPILPNQTGYFDIELDPTGTEVSIEYTITIDFSNMPSDLQILGYTLNSTNELEKVNLPANNTFTGTINLTNRQALTVNNKKTYRIYWKWVGTQQLDSGDDYYVDTNINIKQVIA